MRRARVARVGTQNALVTPRGSGGWHNGPSAPLEGPRRVDRAAEGDSLENC